MPNRWLRLIGVLLFAAPAADAEIPYLYELEGLGDLGGGGSRAAAINNHDAVVGESETASGDVEAFLWTPGAAMRSLGTLGGPASRAYDINDAGMVVGESLDSNDVTTAFSWSKETGMVALPVPANCTYSAALAINAAGQIVGTIENEQGTHAVMWSGTNMVILHRMPGSGIVQPLDVNGQGDVVGNIGMGDEYASSTLAFYFKGGVLASNLAEFRLVSALSGSAAVAINQHGRAAGYVLLDASQVRAFHYDPATGLGLLENRGAIYATATDLNDDGWTVGSYIPSYASDESACLWRNGRSFDLNEITHSVGYWWLTQGSAINRRGVIAGHGLRADQTEAFIIRPVAGARFEDWPDVSIYVHDAASATTNMLARQIDVHVPDDIDVMRVVFFENDREIGAVEKPPFAWDWEGARGATYQFHARVIEPSGRMINSRRITLDDAP